MDGLTVNENVTRIWVVKTFNKVDNCRFSVSCWPTESNRLASLDGTIQSVVYLHFFTGWISKRDVSEFNMALDSRFLCCFSWFLHVWFTIDDLKHAECCNKAFFNIWI